VPHPFRFFLRKGWDTNEFWVYTISENAIAFYKLFIALPTVPQNKGGPAPAFRNWAANHAPNHAFTALGF
jgi:hypothetical protein